MVGERDFNIEKETVLTDVVNGSVITAKDEEGPCCVTTVYGNHILIL